MFWFFLAATFLASDYIHFYATVLYLLLQLFCYFHIDIHSNSITLPLLWLTSETLEVSQERECPPWIGKDANAK